MTKPNFATMTRNELKKYLITHREDEEAFQVYMQCLDTDVKWVEGDTPEGMKLFDMKLKQKQ